MKFVLEPSVFAPARTLALLRLFGFAIEGRHRVVVRNVTEFDAWVATLKTEDAHGEISEAIDLSTREDAHRPSGVELFVGDRVASSWANRSITLADALLIAGQPFYVLVENAASDGRFLRAMMTEDERRWFDERVEKEWVILAGAGGIHELTKRVRATRRAGTTLGLRSAVLFDSDAVEAGQPHPSSGSAATACAAVPELPHHCLERRCIENYLPPEVLENAKGPKKPAKAAAALRQFPRRHFYNMKRGHRGDRGRTPPVPWLPVAENTPLEDGFGDDVNELFDRVRNDQLRADGGFDELRHFITELQRRIQ